MSRYEEGQVIELRDLEGGGAYLDEVYVKGHVSDEVANAAVEAWLEYEFDGEEVDYRDRPRPEYGPWKHGYARWSMETIPCEPEGMQVIRWYSEPGRGRFPVTWAENVDFIEARARRKADEEAARAECLKRFPGVEVVHVWPNGVDFRVPQMSNEHKRTIRWRRDEPDVVGVPRIDRPAWEYERQRRAEQELELLRELERLERELQRHQRDIDESTSRKAQGVAVNYAYMERRRLRGEVADLMNKLDDFRRKEWRESC